MKKRTIDDLAVYMFICDYKRAGGGQNPTYPEIMAHFACGYAAAVNSVKRLITAGVLEKTVGGYAVVGGKFTAPVLPAGIAEGLRQYRYTKRKAGGE